MATSIAVDDGNGALSWRIACVSRDRIFGRSVWEICGRVGAEADIEITDVVEDSGSKRAERMAESLEVSAEAGIILDWLVVIAAMLCQLEKRENKRNGKRRTILQKQV